MKRKFSIAHLTALNCTPPELIYIAARTGYDFVSLRPIHLGLPDEPKYELDKNKPLFKETKAALSETGIQLLDIELARVLDGMDTKSYLPAFEAAAELGGKHVLSSIWTDDRIYAIERFHEICELAEPFGLTVELEFVPVASVKTLKGAMDVLEAAKPKNAGLMIDLHHFHRSGDSLEELKKIPDHYFKYFHLCDIAGEEPASAEEMKRMMREERLYPGEGGIDIAGIVNSLPPEIPCSLEIPHLNRTKELGDEEYIRRCLRAAREYLEAHATKEKSLRLNEKNGMNI